MLAKANRDRLAVLLSETESGDAGETRYAAALRWADALIRAHPYCGFCRVTCLALVALV